MKNNRWIFVLIVIVVVIGLFIVLSPSIRENIAGQAFRFGDTPKFQRAVTNLPHGYTCYNNLECRSGSCQLAPAGVFSLSGRICVGPFLAHGDSCGVTDVCASGLSCQNGLCLVPVGSIVSGSGLQCYGNSECFTNVCHNGQCILGICGDNIRTGTEECDWGEINGISCSSTSEPWVIRGSSCCDSDCRLSFVPITRGSSCTNTRQCETGLSCQNGLCLRGPGTVTWSSLCYHNSECRSGNCLIEVINGLCSDRSGLGYGCDYDSNCQEGVCFRGVCELPVIAREGDACNLGNYRCEQNLICAIVTTESQAIDYPDAKVCITPRSKVMGEVCERDEECRSGSCSGLRWVQGGRNSGYVKICS